MPLPRTTAPPKEPHGVTGSQARRRPLELQGDCHGSDPARSCSSTSPAAVPSLVPVTSRHLRCPVKLRIAPPPPASCVTTRETQRNRWLCSRELTKRQGPAQLPCAR